MVNRKYAIFAPLLSVTLFGVDVSWGSYDLNRPEHLATFTQAASQFTYYLSNANYSIAGTGNADGSVIERFNYSSTGDFAGRGPVASDFYHDADNDGDIDLHDLASFQRCFKPSGAAPAGCLPVHDFDTAGLADGHIDLNDYARFFECFRGPFFTPDQVCAIPPNTAGLLVSGAFTLHGRPADVLSDGHTLLDFRARSYDPVLGRWLQRDGLGYIEGRNLYEAFGTNPLSRLDPYGLDSVQRKGDFLEYTTNGFAWDFAKVIGNGLVLIDHPQWPFAFKMREQDALREFNTGPFTDDYHNVLSIMAHATSLVTQPRSKNLIAELLDKRATSLGWITPGELENEGLEDFRRLGAAGLQAQLAGVGNLTATAFTITTGALAAPAGAGAAAVDVLAAGADAASGRVPLTDGAIVITAVVVGAALHLQFADDAVIGAGSAGRRIGVGAYQDVGGHHIHAKSAFRGHLAYDPAKGFAVSQEYMRSRGWVHELMTARQRELFRNLAVSGRSNTLREHSRIAVEALIAGGTSKEEARSLVARSLVNLRSQGVRTPANLPWLNP